MTNTQENLVQAIQKGNQPLIDAINSLKTAVEAGATKQNSSLTEQVPEWDEDCEGPGCDVTGSPCPEDKLVSVDGWRLHPTVAEMILRQGITAEEALSEDAYQKIFPAPMKTVHREKARPTWTRELLPTATRPVLMAAAKDVGLKDRCKAVGIDYRRETKEWIVSALEACLNRDPLPPPQSEKNKRDYNA